MTKTEDIHGGHLSGRTTAGQRIRPVERSGANTETLEFYDKAEERFDVLLNVFKMFGHQPEYGRVFTETIMAILKDGELEWRTKELLIIQATRLNGCSYCATQHERVAGLLEIPAGKVSDINARQYRRSRHFTQAEKALLDLGALISARSPAIPTALWDRLFRYWTKPQIVEAVFVISTYIAVSRFAVTLGVELEPWYKDPEESAA